MSALYQLLAAVVLNVPLSLQPTTLRGALRQVRCCPLLAELHEEFIFSKVRPYCAGATSSTLQKNYSGLCTRLSSIASCVAIAVGVTVLAAGWGIRLPFGMFQ